MSLISFVSFGSYFLKIVNSPPNDFYLFALHFYQFSMCYCFKCDHSNRSIYTYWLTGIVLTTLSLCTVCLKTQLFNVWIFFFFSHVVHLYIGFKTLLQHASYHGEISFLPCSDPNNLSSNGIVCNSGYGKNNQCIFINKFLFKQVIITSLW